MSLNLPMLLTWLRILLIPLMVCVYYVPEGWLMGGRPDLIASLIFMVAGATDWLDGFLARRWNETSGFGAFLDPVADKLIVATALIILVQLDRVDAIIASIIIGREITISSLREWMAQIGKSKNTAVSMIGKVKTMAQMLAIVLLLYHDPLMGISALVLGKWLIYFAAVMTLWSMGYYMRVAWPHLKERT